MLSVVIPTLDDERTLGPTLGALIPATLVGILKEVVIADGGSTDETDVIAEATGCIFVAASNRRGKRLVAGVRAVERADWFLFLNPDTVLSTDWEAEAASFIERVERSGDPRHAAVFRFRLDGFDWKSRLREGLAGLRCRLFGIAYANQGLLISRWLYDDLGGHRDLPAMEDVDLIRRIGRRRLHFLTSAAVNPAAKQAEGERRPGMVRNGLCLALLMLRVPPRMVARLQA
ncbi:glycosyltransferase involved in cell wall biosynthesis [Rhodobium orientis]|uniref:Glycosyltransferase 2-like domain-containing protein n=2 Tax=Rhodobium orientis TaxID=34017 RepID=A0A327JJ19_9HYPH|nr:glycosyltransferase [Rhodobium orientis]MBB4305635.1 glycosyltransferase involved in cell wall biosynthesis [Rhodobium orientis]MBK5949149.1 hypothetical protein [Rhodobium orientis]RAI24802.1 hypothetical protein CH339_21070 [Rhodobium orientis]